jgi:Na+-transporting NADH:ubiquinone oxidoreductase subunit B
MKSLKRIIEDQRHHFERKGKLKFLFPLYEMFDTFIFAPANVTEGTTHVRDHLDLKRLMIIVYIAVIPAMLMGIYNAGLQANMALAKLGLKTITGWRGEIFALLHINYDPLSLLSNFAHGALYFLPIYLVTLLAGGFWELLFAIIRKHEINEGFLVTSVLFPLILPPTIPLWQVALGISFGIVIGKEIYGGVGMNLFNPALISRAFLFFAYPAQMSGESVWVGIDGYSGATALSVAAQHGLTGMNSMLLSISGKIITWQDAFFGFIPGSIGETSTIAILIGALILIVTGIGSWRIMLSVVLSAGFLSLLMNLLGSKTNPMFSLTPEWHLVLGGFAFGTVFMATDPVSAAMTDKGKYFYGALIGFMVILIRVVNPAFPEGMMLAILFGNMFAPFFDYFAVQANIKRRIKRNGK